MYWFKPCAGQEIIATCSNGVMMRSAAQTETELSKEHRTAVLEDSQQLHDPADPHDCATFLVSACLYFYTFHYPPTGFYLIFPYLILYRGFAHFPLQVSAISLPLVCASASGA